MRRVGLSFSMSTSDTHGKEHGEVRDQITAILTSVNLQLIYCPEPTSWHVVHFHGVVHCSQH